MLNVILKLRLRQFQRFLIDLGFVRSLIVIGAGCLALIAVIKYSGDRQAALIISAIAAFQIVTLHLRRSDIRFINICFENPLSVLRFEYTLISLPVIVSLLIRQNWIASLVVILAAILIPLVDLSVRQVTLNSPIQRIIPNYFFEWKAGVRKVLFPLLIVWFGGLIFSFFIGSVPIALFLIGVFITGFYDKFEALPILLAEEQSAGHFLRRKISRHLLLFSLIAAPLILAFVIFHPAQFYIPIGEFLLLSTLLTYAICLKYAFYQPHADTGVGQTLVSIGFLGVLIPFLTPVVAIMTIRYYLKAKINLHTHLHDFD